MFRHLLYVFGGDFLTTLIESEHFIIESEYETVFLTDKSNGRRTVIGDFYGDAEGAIIDRNEEFAAVFGCGVIVYYLTEPFEEYRYDTVCAQWKEFFRDRKVWISAVEQVGDNQLMIIFENGTAQFEYL